MHKHLPYQQYTYHDFDINLASYIYIYIYIYVSPATDFAAEGIRNHLTEM